jgi:hypothetical protein
MCGMAMASIADSKSQQTKFYALGAKLFDMMISTIQAETLGVNLPDQSSATLRRGVPQSFKENRHAD